MHVGPARQVFRADANHHAVARLAVAPSRRQRAGPHVDYRLPASRADEHVGERGWRARESSRAPAADPRGPRGFPTILPAPPAIEAVSAVSDEPVAIR